MTELTTRQILDQAMGFHRAGDAPSAEEIYHRVLSREPNHAEALHLLGLLSSQMGRQSAALELIERAIHADPLAAEYRVNGPAEKVG
jgi:tetratricopeptide (TPR) repeat protein